MTALDSRQVDAFWKMGCLTLPGAVTAEQLAGLRTDLAGWVEESRRHSAAFGEMLDGRPRFDVEPGHSSAQPALRRVASPTELSANYLAVVQDSPMIDMIADLLGPDLRFHHSKVNSKLPGAATMVRWHQDFAFDPHSNDDMITALLFLDDVTEENGPLRIVPGGHRGPLFSHWHDGVFTGTVDAETAADFQARAQSMTGPAGSVCLMHVRLAHASNANLTAAPRSLFIAAVSAADALPLAPCAVPSIHGGMILRGREPGRIRSIAFELETPEVPEGASFFVQQAGPGST